MYSTRRFRAREWGCLKATQRYGSVKRSTKGEVSIALGNLDQRVRAVRSSKREQREQCRDDVLWIARASGLQRNG